MPKESNTQCADDLLASTAEGMYPQNYTEEIYVLNILGLNRLASLRLRGT